MKRTMISLIVVLAVTMVFAYAYALQGPCVTCHTMHNSQFGNSMNFDDSAIPNGLLLRGTCIGCHAQDANGATNIVLIGTTGIPQVLHNDVDPVAGLAGGNFRFGDATNHQSHNVLGLPSPYGDPDTDLVNNPPGYLSGYDPAATDFNTANQLRCAGQNGCHGNRDQSDEYTAIRGGHHFLDTALKFGGPINEAQQGGGTGGTTDITTTGRSYRFLYNVHGGEDNDWQNTVSSTDHNEYKGVTFGGRGQTQTWADITSISDLCAECHGKFHSGVLTGDSGIGTGTPWLRHPTDALIPNTPGSEYASISTTYDPDTPVARQIIPNTKDTPVAPGTDIVMCLSCHRAHGSGYESILRWAYETSLSAGQGCLRCHTQKSPY